MTRYLISFGAHAMDHIPGGEMPAVAKAWHGVAQEAINAGVWVFGGGPETRRRASWPPAPASPSSAGHPRDTAEDVRYTAGDAPEHLPRWSETAAGRPDKAVTRAEVRSRPATVCG